MDLIFGLQMIPVLVAAILVGNWFLSEVHKSRREGGPWYRPYVSAPGVLILLVLLVPVVVWWMGI